MGAQLGVSVLVLFCTIAPSPGQAYIYAVSVCFQAFICLIDVFMVQYIC